MPGSGDPGGGIGSDVQALNAQIEGRIRQVETRRRNAMGSQRSLAGRGRGKIPGNHFLRASLGRQRPALIDLARRDEWAALTATARKRNSAEDRVKAWVRRFAGRLPALPGHGAGAGNEGLCRGGAATARPCRTVHRASRCIGCDPENPHDRRQSKPGNPEIADQVTHVPARTPRVPAIPPTKYTATSSETL